MTIQIIQTILMLMLLALVLYANKTVDQRIKQIKTDYYSKGYSDGAKFVNKMIKNFTNEVKNNRKNKQAISVDQLNEHEVL
jgi:hypothetical protein